MGNVHNLRDTDDTDDTVETEDEQAPAVEADARQDSDPDDRMRLAAIKALTIRLQKLEQDHKACQQKWREILTTTTQQMHELIEEDRPIKHSREQVLEIRNLLKARRQAEAQKKTEMASIAAKTEQTTSARYELIMTNKTTNQMSLGFGGDDPWISEDSARELNEALTDVVSDAGGHVPADLALLRNRLDDMGIGAIKIAPPPDGESSEIEQKEEDEPSDGELEDASADEDSEENEGDDDGSIPF